MKRRRRKRKGGVRRVKKEAKRWFIAVNQV
jgi:hypothetical protein